MEKIHNYETVLMKHQWATSQEQTVMLITALQLTNY